MQKYRITIFTKLHIYYSRISITINKQTSSTSLKILHQKMLKIFFTCHTALFLVVYNDPCKQSFSTFPEMLVHTRLQERNDPLRSFPEREMVKDVRKKEGTQPDNSKWPAFKCKTHRISLRVCCASGGSDGFPWWGGEFRETRGFASVFRGELRADSQAAE